MGINKSGIKTGLKESNMTRNHFLLPFIVFLWILESCNSDSKTNHSAINDESLKFIGEWYSTKRVYPFGATLIINADSGFTYKYGACGEHGVSYGKWKITNHCIILNNGNPDSSLFLIPFDYRGTPFIDPGGKSKAKADFPIIQEKAKDYDNQFVLFKSDKLFVRNDTLFHATKFKEFDPRMRNMFTRNKSHSF